MPSSRYRHSEKQTPVPSLQAQLELQLGCSLSASGDPSQSRELSKGKRALRRQARLATSPTIHELHGIVRASSVQFNNDAHIRQCQRFMLTSLNLTLMNDVKENRWCEHNATLPPFTTSTEPEPRSGCAHVRRGSSQSLPKHSLGRYQRRAGLPALRMRCGL